MDDLQKRRYDREQRRLKIIKDDIKPEILLKEEMELAKMKVAGNTPMIERIRLLGNIESDTQNDQ